MAYRFQNSAWSHLTKALTQTGTVAKVPGGDYRKFLSGFADGDLMCLLRSATAREIVKVDIEASNQFNGLVMARGQESTSSPVDGWPIGTLIFFHVTAEAMEDIIQPDAVREIAYNPNGVLSPNYKYEEVYQTDLQLWWKAISDSGTEWRLIVGVKTIATPTMDPETGEYGNGQTVTLSCATSGAVIRYTVDGTDPEAPE